jgi:hypothetical protein
MDRPALGPWPAPDPELAPALDLSLESTGCIESPSRLVERRATPIDRQEKNTRRM